MDEKTFYFGEEMKPLTGRFFERYDHEFWKQKVSMLNFTYDCAEEVVEYYIDNPIGMVNKSGFSEDEKKELVEELRRTVKIEYMSTAFHSIEALLMLMVVIHDNRCKEPWMDMKVLSPTRDCEDFLKRLYSHPDTNPDEILSEKDIFNIFLHGIDRVEMEESEDITDEELNAIDQSIEYITAYLRRLTELFFIERRSASERGDENTPQGKRDLYNSFKHGFRITTDTGTVEIEQTAHINMNGEEGDTPPIEQKVARTEGDFIIYLKDKKRNPSEGGGKRISRAYELLDRDYYRTICEFNQVLIQQLVEHMEQVEEAERRAREGNTQYRMSGPAYHDLPIEEFFSREGSITNLDWQLDNKTEEGESFPPYVYKTGQKPGSDYPRKTDRMKEWEKSHADPRNGDDDHPQEGS